MAIYLGDREFSSFFRRLPNNPNFVPQRATSVWVGNRKVYPPVGRELVLEFTPNSWDSDHIITTSENTGAAPFRDFVLLVPWWATAVDYVLIGGGNGGNGGDGSLGRHGTGGLAAPWVSGTQGRTRESVTVRVGIGAEGASERERPGGIAGRSALIFNPIQIMVANSYAGTQPTGYGDHWGKSPGNHTAFGRTFVGGSGGDRGNPGKPGSAPGAGGGGGNGGTFGAGRPGGRGGDGYAWIRFRSS